MPQDEESPLIENAGSRRRYLRGFRLLIIPAVAAIAPGITLVACGVSVATVIFLLSLRGNTVKSSYFVFKATPSVNELAFSGITSNFDGCIKCYPDPNCERTLYNGQQQAFLFDTQCVYEPASPRYIEYSAYPARMRIRTTPQNGIVTNVSQTTYGFGAGSLMLSVYNITSQQDVITASLSYYETGNRLPMRLTNSNSHGVAWSRPQFHAPCLNLFCNDSTQDSHCKPTLLPGNGTQEVFLYTESQDSLYDCWNQTNALLSYQVPCQMNGTSSGCEVVFRVWISGITFERLPEGYRGTIAVENGSNFNVHLTPEPLVVASPAYRPQMDMLLMLAATEKLKIDHTNVFRVSVTMARDYVVRNPAVRDGVKSGASFAIGNIATGMLVREKLVARKNVRHVNLVLTVVSQLVISTLFNILESGELMNSITESASTTANLLMVQVLLGLFINLLACAANELLPGKITSYTGDTSACFCHAVNAARLFTLTPDEAATSYYVSQATQDVIEDVASSFLAS